MYASNPYGAAVQDIASKAAASASASQEKQRDAKGRDSVLSRVPKRAQVVKPPVKISMAPRFRFAIPDPPTDLKMLRGRLSADATSTALHPHKLELEAKKIALHQDISFGIRADLVLPAQYARRDAPCAGDSAKVTSEPLSVSPDDEVILLNAVSSGPTREASGLPPLHDGVTVKSGRGLLDASKRAQPTAAFPWMRRMSYDEYFSSSKRPDSRKPVDPNEESEAAVASRNRKQAVRMQQQALESFERAKKRDMRHPDPAKSHLRPKRVLPVFRNVSDVYTGLMTMQFDRVAPLERVSRFEGNPKEGQKAFQSAVTLSVADRDSKKHIAVYIPDEDTMRTKEEQGKGLLPVETHDRLREFAIRDATGSEKLAGADAKRPSKRTFVMAFVGEGDNAYVSLSDVPQAFLLAPRQGSLDPLSRGALDLSREPRTPEEKRARRTEVVELLTSKL